MHGCWAHLSVWEVKLLVSTVQQNEVWKCSRSMWAKRIQRRVFCVAEGHDNQPSVIQFCLMLGLH